MEQQLKQVQEFMDLLNIPHNRAMDGTAEGTRELAIIGLALNRCATRLESKAESLAGTDLRLTRAQLIVEETSELVVALMRKDEVQCCDAIADLLYVVLGAALTFDWPITQLFAEVHKSNMSKRLRKHEFTFSEETDVCRHDVKGEGYCPPRIDEVLKTHRIARLDEAASEILEFIEEEEGGEDTRSREEIQSEADADHENRAARQLAEDNQELDRDE